MQHGLPITPAPLPASCSSAVFCLASIKCSQFCCEVSAHLCMPQLACWSKERGSGRMLAGFQALHLPLIPSCFLRSPMQAVQEDQGKYLPHWSSVTASAITRFLTR